MSVPKLWAIVPVKPFAAAKQRLAGALDPVKRADLARAMLADVLATLRRWDGFAGILVVTSDPGVMALAHDYGAEVCVDLQDVGTNAAVAQGLDHLEERALAVAVLPSDLPFLQTTDLAAAVAALASARCVIAPALRDEGTNFLGLRPLRAVRPAFGPRSFNRHLALAGSAGVRPKIIRTDGFGLDIDTEFDLTSAAERLPAGRSRDFIEALGPVLAGNE